MPVIYPREIPDPEYVLVPEGEYTVKVIRVEEKTSAAGNEMWLVTFQITAGEYLGKKLFTNLVFAEKALGNVKVFCKAIGIDMEVDSLDLRPEEIDGASLRATVTHEEYKGDKEKLKGKMQSKIPYAGFASLLDKPSPPPPPVQWQANNTPAKVDQFSGDDCPF